MDANQGAVFVQTRAYQLGVEDADCALRAVVAGESAIRWVFSSGAATRVKK